MAYANQCWAGVQLFWTTFQPWWDAQSFPGIIAGAVTATMAWFAIRRLVHL
jgi:hypothetical protein